MTNNTQSIFKKKYLVLNNKQAKEIAKKWLLDIKLANITKIGLPEIDNRRHCWYVPICAKNGEQIGDIVINTYSAEIILSKTTKPETLIARLLKQGKESLVKSKSLKREYKISNLKNTIGLGNSFCLLDKLPSESIDLIFTSPPYYNARPEYSEYIEYNEYLSQMRQIIKKCHSVLIEGRFFVINLSPVLIRRPSRNKSSKRLAIPFDFHRIFIEEGYDFIDDIIWEKPEGAGWATGRGRRFSVDRNPLAYKPVPVTEYILVYRKKTDLLIDWFIRNHPDRQSVEDSKILGDYDRTNIWKINPVKKSKHPAAFPKELAKRVIRYYSFIGDIVLDPFAGSGTVGDAAAELGRRFVLFDNNPEYIKIIKYEMASWKNVTLNNVSFINC